MILLLLALFLVLLFGFVVFFGPPYLPTLSPQIDSALNLLNLSPGQVLLELGSGDGRVMRAAAARGLQVVGIELNPLLVLISRLVTWPYRDRVHVIWGSYWQITWPKVDGIFTFMIGSQMGKLDSHIRAQTKKPLRLVSFAFAVPDRKPSRQHDGVFLYIYS